MHAVTRYIIRVRDGNGDLVGYATEIGADGTLGTLGMQGFECLQYTLLRRVFPRREVREAINAAREAGAIVDFVEVTQAVAGPDPVVVGCLAASIILNLAAIVLRIVLPG